MNGSGPTSGQAASGLSLASIGFQALGDVTSAEGTAAGDKYKAAELDRAAQYGELKAVQTSGQLTSSLNQTLGNIDAVRAASHSDPSSPSDAAVRNQIENVSNEKRLIQVDSINAQAQEDEANAAYLRTSASNALLAGKIGAVGDVFGGLSKAIPMIPGL